MVPPSQEIRMSAKAPRRHVAVGVAPKQLKAIDRDAKKAGVSRRALLEQITEDYLLKPTSLIGGPYRKADRVRLRFHLSPPLHKQLKKVAAQQAVPYSVVLFTAITNHYPY